MTNKSNQVIYTGVTANLQKRVYEHKYGHGGIFISKDKLNKLVYYYAVFENIVEVITEEKRIDGGSRQKKIELVQSMNPQWRDLYDEI